MTAANGDKLSVSLFVRPKIASGDLPFPEQTSPGGELRATDLRAKPQCPHQLRDPKLCAQPFPLSPFVHERNSGYMSAALRARATKSSL